MLGVISCHSCSITPARLFGKFLFDELHGLLLRDNCVWPCEVTVQERSAFAVDDLAVDFKKRSDRICLSHGNRALEIKAWQYALTRKWPSTYFFT